MTLEANTAFDQGEHLARAISLAKDHVAPRHG